MNRERVWERLRGKGLRMTSIKKEVVQIFLDGGCGLSASDVLRRLSGNPHVSTVYRCLSALVEAGFLRPDRNDQGVLRYRCSSSFYPDHGHFKCQVCGRRQPVNYRLPDEFLRSIEKDFHLTIAGTDLFFEGKCSKCSN
jgi:Fe2+ or Zn2+ uptake regulation protein